MNTRAVQKNVWGSIGPFLEGAGFRLAANSARRFLPKQIDVIGLEWFSAAMTKRIHCTPNSFGVRIGCYFRYIPSMATLEVADGEPLPIEAHCHIRRTLFRTYPSQECERKDVWSVDSAGNCLPETILHLRTALLQEAFPWFQRFSDPHEVLRTLREDREDQSQAFGFGKVLSPTRHLYTGFTALQAGQRTLAAEHLSKALAAGCFAGLHPAIQSAIDVTR